MSNQNDQQPKSTEINSENKIKKSSPPLDKAQVQSKKDTNNTSSKGSMVANLALLVALLGSGAAIGLNFWQKNQDNERFTTQQNTLSNQLASQQQNLEQLFTQKNQQQETLLKNQLADAQTKIKNLENLIDTLQASQQNTANKMAQISSDSSQTWALFEAKQLLKQTFLRLRVADVNGATHLLEDINSTIKQQGDLSQAASQVTQSIETALLKLQQVEQVDRPTLYTQLAALQTQIASLKAKQPVYSKQQAPEETEQMTRWEKLADKLSNYVRVDFNANKKVLPLLSMQGINQVKIALNLSIEKAQWAVINSEPQIYQAELDRITQLLAQYFDKSATEVSALLNKVNELKAKTVVTTVPDISDTLSTINRYLDQKIAKSPNPAVTKKGGDE